jgi:hypothetical protein
MLYNAGKWAVYLYVYIVLSVCVCTDIKIRICIYTIIFTHILM